MGRYTAKKHLKEKVRGKAERNAQNLPVEIYSLFLAIDISRDLARPSFEHAHLGNNVRDVNVISDD